jgi:hypothetical protein
VSRSIDLNGHGGFGRKRERRDPAERVGSGSPAATTSWLRSPLNATGEREVAVDGARENVGVDDRAVGVLNEVDHDGDCRGVLITSYN